MWLARSGLGLASLGWTVCMGRPHCSQQRAPPTSGWLAQGVGGAGEAPSGGAEGQWGWLWPPVVSMFPPPAPRQEIAVSWGLRQIPKPLAVFSAHLEPRSVSGPRQPWEAAAVRGQSPPPGLGDKPSGECSSRHWHQVCLAQGFCSAAGGVREWPWQLTCPEAARPDVHSDMHAHGVHTHTHKRVRHNRTDPTHTLLGRPRTHKPPQQHPCLCGRGDSSSPTHRTPASSSKLGALLPVGRAACWAAAARPAHPTS